MGNVDLSKCSLDELIELRIKAIETDKELTKEYNEKIEKSNTYLKAIGSSINLIENLKIQEYVGKYFKWEYDDNKVYLYIKEIGEYGDVNCLEYSYDDYDEEYILRHKVYTKDTLIKELTEDNFELVLDYNDIKKEIEMLEK